MNETEHTPRSLEDALSTLSTANHAWLKGVQDEQPDPEPYADGSYGTSPALSAQSIIAFCRFSELLSQESMHMFAHGRGHDDLGMQYVHDGLTIVVGFPVTGEVCLACIDGRGSHGVAFSSPDHAFEHAQAVLQRHEGMPQDVLELFDARTEAAHEALNAYNFDGAEVGYAGSWNRFQHGDGSFQASVLCVLNMGTQGEVVAKLVVDYASGTAVAHNVGAVLRNSGTPIGSLRAGMRPL